MSAVDNQLVVVRKKIAEKIQRDIDDTLNSGHSRKYAYLVHAALGSIPWLGGFLGTSASISVEHSPAHLSDLHRLWLEEHQSKLKNLGTTLAGILMRFEHFGSQIQDRIACPQYLALFRKGFRVWDQAETEQQRRLIKQLLSNAGVHKICPFDLARLFLNWIEELHDTHLQIIQVLYKKSHLNDSQLWRQLHGENLSMNHAESEVFSFVVEELCQLGAVHRLDKFHYRRTRSQNYRHETSPRKNSNQRSLTVYRPTILELSSLGKQFVHYTMDNFVPRMTHGKS